MAITLAPLSPSDADRLTELSRRDDVSDDDLSRLEDLMRRNAELPEDARRVLLSIRLSVFTDDTTSPIRQEIDLRQDMLLRGWRVIGVASDLDVSATKTPPWKRKSLGDWLTNRAPEYDVIAFWKLDRFIRSLMDLHVMIRWAKDFKKNLYSLNDDINLDTPMGVVLVTLIAFVAEIEAANTKMRLESMWAYAKTQSDWITGNPPYGYRIHRHDEDGEGGSCRECGSTDGPKHKTLLIDEEKRKGLVYARDRLVQDPESTVSEVVRELVAKGLMKKGLATSTLIRRLRSPGIMGYRVECHDPTGKRKYLHVNRLVLDGDGNPIRVGPAIFPEREWNELQAALEARAIKKTERRIGGTTSYRGILKCADCGQNLVVQTHKRHDIKSGYREYNYLRCMNVGKACKGGGVGVHPQVVYDLLSSKVMEALGDQEVFTREYTRGEETRQRVKTLQDNIDYYMTGLAPGGSLSRTEFSRIKAQANLDRLIAELEAIDPSTQDDRWDYVPLGHTFRERWERGGYAAFVEDLARIDLRAEVRRWRAEDKTAVADLRIILPKDVQERLVLRADDFSNPV